MSDHTTSEAPSATVDTAVKISRSVSRPIKDVWNVLMTKEGAETLLGPGAVLGAKGHTWRSTNGRSGVIRSFHPLQQIRFSIRSNDDSPFSMAELTLNAEDNDTTLLAITFTHLPVGKDIDDFVRRWGASLENIAKIAQEA